MGTISERWFYNWKCLCGKTNRATVTWHVYVWSGERRQWEVVGFDWNWGGRRYLDGPFMEKKTPIDRLTLFTHECSARGSRGNNSAIEHVANGLSQLKYDNGTRLLVMFWHMEVFDPGMTTFLEFNFCFW